MAMLKRSAFETSRIAETERTENLCIGIVSVQSPHTESIPSLG